MDMKLSTFFFYYKVITLVSHVCITVLSHHSFLLTWNTDILETVENFHDSKVVLNMKFNNI